MGPVAALSSGLSGAFRFGGRAKRAEFWWTWLSLYCLGLVILLYRSSPVTDPSARYAATIALCVIALPMMSVGTRRLNDAGVWRWLFVVTFVFGVVAQIFYFNKPSRAELQAWQIRQERADIEPWLTGYQIHTIQQNVATALPWIGRPLALICLLLALLPSRAPDPVSDLPEVSP